MDSLDLRISYFSGLCCFRCLPSHSRQSPFFVDRTPLFGLVTLNNDTPRFPLSHPYFLICKSVAIVFSRSFFVFESAQSAFHVLLIKIFFSVEPLTLTLMGTWHFPNPVRLICTSGPSKVRGTPPTDFRSSNRFFLYQSLLPPFFELSF